MTIDCQKAGLILLKAFLAPAFTIGHVSDYFTTYFMQLYHVCDLSIIHICIYYAVGGRIPGNGIGGHLPPHLPPRGHLVRQALQVRSYE